MPWWEAVLLSVLALSATLASLSLAAWAHSAASNASLDTASVRVRIDPLSRGASQAAGFLLALWAGLFVRARGRSISGALALHPVSLRTLALALIAGMALQLPLAEMANWLSVMWPQSIEEQLRKQQLIMPRGPWDAVAIVISVVAIPPLTEELLFRGLILRGLLPRYGAVFAFGLSSLLFGAIHVDPIAIGYATLAGLILGTVAWRTRSTWPALGVHAGVNAVPIILSPKVVTIEGFNTVSRNVQHISPPLAIGSAFLAASVLWVLLRHPDARRWRNPS